MKNINKLLIVIFIGLLISNTFMIITSTAINQKTHMHTKIVGIYDRPIGSLLGSDWGLYSYYWYNTTYVDIFPYYFEVENEIYCIKIIPIEYFWQIDEEEIDVLIVDGISDLEFILGLSNPSKKFRDIEEIKTYLNQFIKDGHGWIGYCGGALTPIKSKDSSMINTWFETWENWNSFLDEDYCSKVGWRFNSGFPILDELAYPEKHDWKKGINKPENVGCFAWGFGNDTYHGAPMNLKIMEEGKYHPILNDYPGDELLIGWAGGPAFEITGDTSDISGLISYDDDLSEDEETAIKAWTIQPASIKGLYTLLKETFDKSNYKDCESRSELIGKIIRIVLYHSPFRKHSTRKLQDNHERKYSLVTIDNYGGENGGRIILDGTHPIKDVFDKDGKFKYKRKEESSWYNNLYFWYNEEAESELDSTDRYSSGLEWYQLRQIAWASKIPDNHMPPIYGRSQVIDFDSSSQSEKFIVKCAVELEKDWNAAYLDLFYRYNDTDSGGWTRWYLYEPDSVVNNPWDFNSHEPWEFNFDMNKANGSGEYEFYSRLRTEKDLLYSVESAPPASVYDARCFVSVTGVAIADYSPKNPLVNQHISFSDQSVSANSIESWQWNFGEGNSSSSQNPTHQYEEDGIYTVSLTITDNESNNYATALNISVYNNPPYAQFFSSPSYIVIGSNPRMIGGGTSKTISLQSSSGDSDGTITNQTWDLGDGNKGYGQTVYHSYNVSNIYPISLKVKDDDNFTDETCNQECILVVNDLVNRTLLTDDPDNFTWNSIQKAFDNSTTLDIIYILNGNYSENLTVNRSIILFGENSSRANINGSITMVNPHDHELVDNGDDDGIVNMSGNSLLFHFNNDTSYGEDYSSSSVVVDFSGQKNNGTIFGASWNNLSIKGPGALLFDGQDDSVNISSISGLSGENVTVSSWINWVNGSGTYDPILSQSNASNGYVLYVNCSNNKPVFKLGSDEVISSISLSAGWHHLVGTHNETSLKIYVDGKLRGTQSKIGSGVSLNAYIGFDNVCNYFNGTIDEVAVWNRTLSDEEISIMYQGNYGVILDNLTVQDSNIGITPCNHSVIQNCRFINNTVGVNVNDTWDIMIKNCFISNSSYGIKVSNVSPGRYDRNIIENVTIIESNIGIEVNSSSNLSIVSSYFNCSDSQLVFNNSNFSNIYILGSDSWGNVAPDTPCKVYDGPTLGDPGTTYTYKTKTNDSNEEQILYQFDWGDGNTSSWLGPYMSNETVEASHSWAEEGGYYITVKAKDVLFNESNSSEPLLFRTETLPPLINSINHTPSLVGFGGNITITANVTDNMSSNWSGIQNVTINITYPDNSSANYTINSIDNNTYEYVFNNTWLVGQYNYNVWAVDNAYNTNSSTGYNFNVSAQANISVCALKDEYGDEEQILLTDPPSGGSPLIGYEMLNDGEVLHIWNKYDSYYFNTSSGIQLTNHYNEYWSHNVLMLGYYNNNQWNLIYRTDELSGFNKEIETDNETYVNVTMWKNLEYYRYDLRLAIRYYLGVDNNELTVIPYIKNLDENDIPYTLGFGWEMKDIQIDMTSTGDYIDVNGTMYYLNKTLDNTYTDLLESEFYLMENVTDISTRSLFLKWNDSLTYKLQVKSRLGQYNAPVTLFIRIGTLASGQEKYTKMYWYDAAQETYYFNSYDSKEFWTNNPNYMVDGSTSNYASTSTDTDVELCNDNTCNGTDLGTISKVELRVNGYFSGDQRDIILRPVLNGITDGNNYYYQAGSTQGTWSPWFDITSEPGGQWTWNGIDTLDCDVEMGTGMLPATVYASKVEIRVTYNIAPVVSNPVPADGSSNITPNTVLSITISDSDGDSMNITWYTNSTPSTLTLRPNANGSSTQLERIPAGSSANYECVDETTYNDSDYVKMNGISWKNDTYEIQNHSDETGCIHFIKVYARCARIGSAETANISSYGKITINSGGSYYYGQIFKPPRSNSSPGNFTNYSYIWTFNPVTGNAWTWSDVDNLEAGVSFIGNQGTSRCSQIYVEVSYTNSSSSWVAFGTNNSVGNGTYHQVFTKASMNGRWWYWKVYVNDGKTGVYSGVYKFYTGCESKIKNTGSTNISGYLLIQVQYFDTTNSTWVVADDVINESTVRTINGGGELGLDTVFNGLVNTSDLSSYGNGSYRIYAAFRDSDGIVLICDDETELEATNEFTITFE